jgi:hypothetical protein
MDPRQRLGAGQVCRYGRLCFQTSGAANCTPKISRNPRRPARCRASQPRSMQTDPGAEVAGNVVAPLAPVEAGSAENPAAGSRRCERGTEFPQKFFSCGSQRTAFVVEHDEFIAGER